ncbi:MAG: DNA polymerase III subunit gamma and tau [Actinomycetota bacterium]|nr:DNA polymerase III subunit gamma and tau [Actinomycetota bacterium]
MALYRKYRPGTLAEVKGQEHVTGPLRQALLNGKVHHAYLFSGPRGCGKTSSARILARSLNCEKGPTPDPCNECDSCVALAPNGPGTLDVIEIDAASNNGVDDARDLRERAFYAPVSSRYKIYIIDEAHMVTPAAFNALLKLVEEPPEFLRFVFATTEPEKVLGTIKSRTHHYPFRLMPRADLTALLDEVVAKEGVPVDPTVLPLVVRAAAGSARDGLSILDQVLASAGPDGVTREGAAQLLGVTPDTLLDDVIDAFAAHDGAAVFSTVDTVMESGLSPRRFVEDVLQRLRDLVVLSAVPDAVDHRLLDVPEDQLPAMVRQAQAIGPAGLSRAADLFHEGLTELKGTTAPRLLLELLCARVLLPGASTDEAALLSRLERLERRLDIGGAAPAPASSTGVASRSSEPAPASLTTTPVPSTAPGAPVTSTGAAAPTGVVSGSSQAPVASRATTPVQQPWPETAALGGTPGTEPAATPAVDTPSEGGLDAAALRRSWDAVLDAVNSRKRTTKALLLNATVVSLSGKVLTLGFTTAGLIRTFQTGTNEEVLREALQTTLGLDAVVKLVVGTEAPTLPVSDAPAAPAYEGLAPGDEIEAVDPEAPAPERAVHGDDAALALLQDELGARVVSTTEP